MSSACSGGSLSGDDTGLQPIVGEWRGVLLTQGGDLPFAIRVDPEGSRPAAVVLNGASEIAIESVARQGAASYTLAFAGAASHIVARMSPDGEELSGYWRYEAEPEAGGPGVPLVVQMPFSGRKSDRRRFPRNDPNLEIATPAGIAAVPDVAGRWLASAGFATGGATISAEWSQEGEIVVAQALATPGGDAPDMVGIYRNGLLRLSWFDGRRALMIHARATAEGALEGEAWVNDAPAVPWTTAPRP